MIPTGYKAVIYDLDGTLYDKLGFKRRLVLRDLKHIKLILAERKVRKSLAGQYLPGAVAKTLFSGISKITRTPVKKVERWFYGKYMRDMVAILSESYGARQSFVDEIHILRERGVKLAVFSDYSAVSKKLGAIGIDPSWFDVVTDAPSEGGLKPCREAFLNVAFKLGVDPSQILVTGDRQDTDGDGALAAGMSFRLV